MQQNRTIKTRTCTGAAIAPNPCSLSVAGIVRTTVELYSVAGKRKCTGGRSHNNVETLKTNIMSFHNHDEDIIKRLNQQTEVDRKAKKDAVAEGGARGGTKWRRYRFETKSVNDYRPLVFNPKYPWWCSGFRGDMKRATIIAYLPPSEDLYKYWDDASQVEFTEHESKELDEIDCHACKKIIESDEELKLQLANNNGARNKNHRKKKGFRLLSEIRFGKYRGKTLQWIIDKH